MDAVPLGRPKFVEYSSVPLGTDIVHGTYDLNVNYSPIILNDGTPATMIYHWGEGFFGGGFKSYNEYRSRWDAEIRVLGDMQVKLGRLSDDVRLIRAQITMFRRCHYTFPDSVTWILESIGEGRHLLGRPVGCALPWWPRTELEHVEKMTETQINLCRWLNGEEVDPGQPPESAAQLRQFYEWLGERTELKECYVERMLWLPDRLAAEVEKRIDGLTATTPETDPIRRPRDSKYGAPDNCWHLYFRVLEIYLRSVGGGGWRAGMPPVGESAKVILAARRCYLNSLDFWLRGVPLETAQAACPSESEGIGRTYALLQDPDPTKRWLAGCLWKTLKTRESYAKSDEYDRCPGMVPSEWLALQGEASPFLQQREAQTPHPIGMGGRGGSNAPDKPTG